MSYPTPYIRFRRLPAALPVNLSPADCNPSAMGIQLTAIPLWVMRGTPSLELAFLAKGPRKVPSSPPGVLSADNPLALQGCEVRVYLDTRVTRTADFKSDGTTSGVRLAFVGDMHEVRPAAMGQNQWYAYVASASGLIARAERVAVMAPVDSSTAARFNMNALSVEYDPQTGGKTIGEAVRLVLEDYGVAYRLDANGIGKYAFDPITETAALPAQTLKDLEKLDLVPPFEFRVAGDNVVAAIHQCLDAYCPNYGMMIQPDGMIRFWDIRRYDAAVIDLQEDPVDQLTYSRSTMSSYSRVRLQGGPKVVPYYVQWQYPRENQAYNLDDSPDNDRFTGMLVESFATSTQTNLQAKVAYSHGDWTPSRALISIGTVSTVGTSGSPLPSNQIRLIPDVAATVDGNNPNVKDWLADELTLPDGTPANRRDCRLMIRRKITRASDGLVVSMTGGEFLPTSNDATVTIGPEKSSVVTTSPNVDRPPAYFPSPAYVTEYTYEMFGYSPLTSVVWRQFKVVLDPKDSVEPDNHVRRKLATYFTLPVDNLKQSHIDPSYWRTEDKTWLPRMLVEYRFKTGGVYTYDNFWVGFRIDTLNNVIVLDRPCVVERYPNGTYENLTPPWNDNQDFQIVPYNIKACLPVIDGRHEAVYPPDGSPDVATVKARLGIDRDLPVEIPEWQDGRDAAYAMEHAKHIWQAVERPLVEGGFGWMAGVPDDWWVFGLKDMVVSGETLGVLQAFQVVNESTCDPEQGSGLEDVTLIMTSATLMYGPKSAPYVAVAFSTAKPRISPAMRDFHSFDEMIQRG